MEDEPALKCQNCSYRYFEDHDYCPECSVAAVEQQSPICPFHNVEMEFREAPDRHTEAHTQYYLYYCPECDSETLTPVMLGGDPES